MLYPLAISVSNATGLPMTLRKGGDSAAAAAVPAPTVWRKSDAAFVVASSAGPLTGGGVAAGFTGAVLAAPPPSGFFSGCDDGGVEPPQPARTKGSASARHASRVGVMSGFLSDGKQGVSSRVVTHRER